MASQRVRAPGAENVVRFVLTHLLCCIGALWAIASSNLIASGLAKGQDLPSFQQRLPRQLQSSTAALQGIIYNEAGLGLGDAIVTLQDVSTRQSREVRTTGDGVFRFLNLPAGSYVLHVSRAGFEPIEQSSLQLHAGDLVSLELVLKATPVQPTGVREIPRPGLPPLPPAAPSPALPPYPSLPRSPAPPPTGQEPPLEPLPPDEQVFTPMPDRWEYQWPVYRRYDQDGEYPYTVGHWYDPFNRNRLKGDYPIFGNRTFFTFTGISDTFVDGRRLPTPSGVPSELPNSEQFFGKPGQFFTQENLALSLDLFHGDTSFRPIDWQVKVTPVFNLNYLHTQELGIVNANPLAGTNRLDGHIGLQEAFVEAKLKDLSPDFDFVSVRAGIQGFNSDFRGFIFNDEEPGVRIFGNLQSNRYEYNLAYFSMLEKDTNSGLNTLTNRHQQVYIANLYRQDFLTKGYTVQLSFLCNNDNGTLRFDTNNFLVRPSPIGLVVQQGQACGSVAGCVPPLVKQHSVRAYYLGLNGNGHVGRWNVSNAFYQALGYDTFNPIARQRVSIDAQMAALELSRDHNWLRFKASFFWSSGSSNPQSPVARGFDAIFDNPNFAGGFFSFWNREGIRLTGSGVGLVGSDSLIPSLRSSKIQGQANFVNPGLFLWNVGTDIDVTPKLKSFVNVNLIRFQHTAPLETVLFQSPIHAGVGADSSIGFNYRPPLSDNIVLTGGVSMFNPWQGFKDIYTGETLFSLFANIRFLF
jgi:hypothetical protein